MPRIDHVRAALLEAGVIKKRGRINNELVEEVDFALHPPKHEGSQFSYGCLLLADCPKTRMLNLSGLEKGPARELADGVNTFVISTKGKHTALLLQPAPSDDEIELLELRERFCGILVHRSTVGTVRVITDGGIYVFEEGGWKLRPHSASVTWRVCPELRTHRNVMDSILRFAFHVLSPAGVGATLVYWIRNPKSIFDDGASIDSAKLSLARNGHYFALRSLLRQHDGATFIASNGRVCSYGHHLKYSQTAASLIKQVGGTRHTSAKRFSFDEDRAIVTVVSEDGPVSVFSDGVKVSELSEYGTGDLAGHLRWLAPENTDRVESWTFYKHCPNCKKPLSVETTLVYGMRSKETGDCPACSTEVHSDRCFQIDARTVKPFLIGKPPGGWRD